MKKSIMIIALALVPFLMKAQMPMGMPMGMGMGAPAMMQDLPEQTITEQTDKMVEELGLDDNQGAQLLELNKQYLGKITYPVVLPPEAEKAMNEAANEANKTDMAAMAEAFNNMTSEDREKMMSSMQDMENMMAQVEDNQLAYEDGLKSILTKKQMRAWKKGKTRYNNEQRLRMEQQMADAFSRMDGGFGGGFGGGFPGGF
jgi:hypothetical protein